MKKRMIALAVLFYLFVGLSGWFRFPAAFGFSRTITTYHDELREATERVRCRGLPGLISYCEGTVEAPAADASPTSRTDAG